MNQAINQSQPQTGLPHPYETTPFPVMVGRLFKKIPEMPHGSLMHAASALLGEAVEWQQSTSRRNFIEEAGDIEFYIIAIFHEINPLDSAAHMLKVDKRSTNLELGTVMANVATLCNDVFDIAKKAWVYGKEPDTIEIARLLLVLQMNLDFAYELYGTDRKTVHLTNKRKLIGPGGRYESGFYSDAQAIARKDKLTGDDFIPSGAPVERTFIGKKDE